MRGHNRDSAGTLYEAPSSSLASVQPSFAFSLSAGRQSKGDKKRRRDDGSDAEDNDRGKRPRNITRKKAKARVRCPFKDHEPDNPKFEQCGSFDEWIRLREHLLARKHRPREQCPRCGETFKDAVKWEEHTSVGQACQESSQQLERPSWINKDQAAQIKALSPKGRKTEGSLEEMHRKVCKILFGYEIAPARTASGNSDSYPHAQHTDDSKQDDRSQEHWTRNFLTWKALYDPTGAIPGEPCEPFPHGNQDWNAYLRQSSLYTHANLMNMDSSDSRPEMVNWTHDGPHFTSSAPCSPIDYHSPRMATFAPHTSSHAGHGHGEPSLIQKASPRTELQTELVDHRSRHLVANMEHFGVPIVGPGSPNEKTLGHSSTQTEVPSVEARDDFDPNLSPFEDKSSSMDSSGDSLDSDMLSISSEDSDSCGNLDLDDPLKSTIDQISHRILVEYKVSKGFRSRSEPAHTENGEAGDNSGSSADSADNTRSPSQTQGNEMPQKGKRRAEDRDDGSRRPPRPTKQVAVSSERPRNRALACPFWKRDPRAHGGCFSRKLSRITDVKLHLRRRHKQPAPDYCQRCWVAFEDEAQKTIHLQDNRCRYDPGARPPGIDNAMDVALNKKSKRDQSKEGQWFAIWDIVFPGQPRPASPYIDESLSEDASQLQEFIVNRWPSILYSNIDESGGSGTSTDIERVEREQLYRAVLGRLLDEYLEEHARDQTAGSASTHRSPGTQTSSSSNHADSAIEVGSYRSNNHSSAGSSGDASQTMPGVTTMPQIGTRFATQSQSSAMHNRRERFILPQSQSSSNTVHDHQQQMQIPPPTTSSRTMLPDQLNAQTTDFYGAGNPLEFDFTINGFFPQPAGNFAFQSILESGESDANAPLENMGAHPDFAWPNFEI